MLRPHSVLRAAGFFALFFFALPGTFHPIYVGYIAMAVGVFFVEGHMALLFYPLGLFLLAQLYLVKLEEPRLVERFGDEYKQYCRRVPRWPRPWSVDETA